MMPGTEVMDRLPRTISFSATTETLGIKAAKSCSSRKLNIGDVFELFAEKVELAYAFENLIRDNAPVVYNNIVSLRDTMSHYEEEFPSHRLWEHEEYNSSRVALEKTGFFINVLFRLFYSASTNKNKKLREKRIRLIETIIPYCDDISIWNELCESRIYSITDLTKWYNEKLKNIEAIIRDEGMFNDNSNK